MGRGAVAAGQQKKKRKASERDVPVSVKRRVIGRSSSADRVTMQSDPGHVLPTSTAVFDAFDASFRQVGRRKVHGGAEGRSDLGPGLRLISPSRRPSSSSESGWHRPWHSSFGGCPKVERAPSSAGRCISRQPRQTSFRLFGSRKGHLPSFFCSTQVRPGRLHCSTAPAIKSLTASDAPI